MAAGWNAVKLNNYALFTGLRMASALSIRYRPDNETLSHYVVRMCIMSRNTEPIHT